LGLERASDQDLEPLAGRVSEFNLLVQHLQKQRNQFSRSLSDLESQKLQLEAELVQSREEASSSNLRLGSMTRQIEDLQKKLHAMEEQSRHLTQLLPLVEFASNIAPDIDASMRQIAESAERLNGELARVRNLIDLYDRALPQSSNDLEVIRQYRSFIDYEQIRASMDELVTTIRGGAGWSEQLAGILKRLSPSASIPEVK
jgi:DNA repair exonuclease SbcCD ATPase subunit